MFAGTLKTSLLMFQVLAAATGSPIVSQQKANRNGANGRRPLYSHINVQKVILFSSTLTHSQC